MIFFLNLQNVRKSINQIYYQYHTTKHYLINAKNILKYILILNNFF